MKDTKNDMIWRRKNLVNESLEVVRTEAKIEHNQCERCLKKFRTALGFHKHYIWCLQNGDLKI